METRPHCGFERINLWPGVLCAGINQANVQRRNLFILTSRFLWLTSPQHLANQLALVGVLSFCSRDSEGKNMKASRQTVLLIWAIMFAASFHALAAAFVPVGALHTGR